MSQLKHRYTTGVIPALMSEFGCTNAMQVPRLDKIVVNIGLGEALTNAKAVDAAVGDLALITGQRAIVTKALTGARKDRIRRWVDLNATAQASRP